MWDWIELQLMGCRESEAVTVAERCAKIIRLAELAQAAEDERGYRQYMEQIHIISFVG
jgi:hypothetical protein